MRSARAQAREVAWLQASEARCGIPAARAGGREVSGLVLDIDATLITCHSEKDQAAPTYKGGSGFHPLLCFLANTGEGMVRAPSARERWSQYRRGSHRGAGRRSRTDPRRPTARHRHPRPHRQRRIRKVLPHPRPRHANTRNPHLLLRRHFSW
ncbi:hypothetical protein [Streptomyces sp. ME18-1-4]|uniref:hypothetical protein n=1 Tax=Streptomyces sp. ME18-1-4 TaxID=3028685 RepID=UPI0039F6504A